MVHWFSIFWDVKWTFNKSCDFNNKWNFHYDDWLWYQSNVWLVD